MILAEAERAFAQLGYPGATLHTIADRAWDTQSGLLRNFPSKEKLLFALLEEHFSQDEAQQALAIQPSFALCGGIGNRGCHQEPADVGMFPRSVMVRQSPYSTMSPWTSRQPGG